MTTAQSDWERIRTLKGDELRVHVFEVLRRASLALNAGAVDDPSLLETVPRLAELLAGREELEDFMEPFNALARATGLWNYIDKDTADTTDRFVAEAVTVPELGGITLHREQVEALSQLLLGKNLILSAPTSFGKSLIVDALLLSNRYSRVAIVLPTIALLDEFRRRLVSRVGSSYQIVLHPSQEANEGRVIFLGTQERLIYRQDLGQLDLTVVDEFYKLDPNRKDERSVTLNAAVNKLLHRSKQFFFLGPNIDKVLVTDGGRWKFEFLRTRFSTVAVDTQDLTAVKNKKSRLFDELQDSVNWPSLVFMSSPDKANKMAQEAAVEVNASHSGQPFAEWLETHVGDKSSLVTAVRAGMGLHHGRMQRAIASQMVREFNTQRLPILFCTSTLIEGVNTVAKTVLIYDKQISRTPYDFFTYSNIKGRAGRLGEHHVGRVMLFNAAPEEEEMEVSPTLFGMEDEAPDEYVVHLEQPVNAKHADARLSYLRSQLGLSVEDLRLASGIGLENALAIKNSVAAALKDGKKLVWAGFADFKKVEFVLEVIMTVDKDFGFYKPKQLSNALMKLRDAGTLTEYLLKYNSWYNGKPEAFDNVFKFLRACEYGLPQYFSVVERFVQQSSPGADYSFFVQGMANWFRPPVLKELDEEGVPIQISERFVREGDDMASLKRRLLKAARSTEAELTSFERLWVSAALDTRAS